MTDTTPRDQEADQETQEAGTEPRLAGGPYLGGPGNDAGYTAGLPRPGHADEIPDVSDAADDTIAGIGPATPEPETGAEPDAGTGAGTRSSAGADQDSGGRDLDGAHSERPAEDAHGGSLIGGDPYTGD